MAISRTLVRSSIAVLILLFAATAAFAEGTAGQVCALPERGSALEAVADSSLPQAQTKGIATTSCPEIFAQDINNSYIAPRFDPERNVWEFYVRNVGEDRIERYDVDTSLSYTITVIPIAGNGPWIAEDLDRDGEVELVTQWFDVVRIFSAPDWRQRAEFVWPGTNVLLKPTTFQLDSDPYIEVYATPHANFGGGYAAVIDYNPDTDSFFVASEVIAPNGVAGRSAVADFDEDGRVEFITGNNDFGYELFEWQETGLVYIGTVGDLINAGTLSATACRPKPGGKWHALIGYSSSHTGFLYQLLEPVADNVFEIAHVFQEITGFMGTHPGGAADTDCDGLDELALTRYPTYEVWEWDPVTDSFIQSCVWEDPPYGAIIDWYPIDLDQDGRAEMGALNHLDILYAFPGPDCIDCDTSGGCPYEGLICNCDCLGDPICDGATNVLDVVSAVDVAFRNGLPGMDNSAVCPIVPTDVNCDAKTNVLDVVHLVNVAFKSADPISEFCAVCAP